MSAEACIVYYGLRCEVAPHEIEGLERRTDERIVAARYAGLQTYWANFGASSERFLLFVGAELGVLGVEGQSELQIGALDLHEVMESTAIKLKSAGFDGRPKLLVQWYADA